jgi:hypothetical protein
MTSPAALHSANSDEHFSPADVAHAATKVMGRIDLDPFSCALANRVIGASMFFGPGGAGADGYAEEWGDSADPQKAFVNPPSSRVKRKPAQAAKALVKPGAIHGWWKLLDEYLAGRVEQAIFVSFNMNLFQTGQRFGYAGPYRFPFCVPSRRLKFWGESRAPGEGSPSHASALVYLPPRVDMAERLHWLHAFAETFAVFGEVRL